MRRTAAALLVLVAVHALLVGPAFGEEKAGYSFTLNGEPLTPRVMSLNGTPDDPRSGDVIDVDRFPITLGPPDV